MKFSAARVKSPPGNCSQKSGLWWGINLLWPMISVVLKKSVALESWNRGDLSWRNLSSGVFILNTCNAENRGGQDAEIQLLSNSSGLLLCMMLAAVVWLWQWLCGWLWVWLWWIAIVTDRALNAFADAVTDLACVPAGTTHTARWVLASPWLPISFLPCLCLFFFNSGLPPFPTLWFKKKIVLR